MRRKGLQKLARVFELPEDIITDIARLTLLGNKQLLIENHKGIIEYAPGQIRVKLNDATLVVKGERLSLGNLQTEQILIEGTVEEIHYDT